MTFYSPTSRSHRSNLLPFEQVGFAFRPKSRKRFSKLLDHQLLHARHLAWFGDSERRVLHCAFGSSRCHLEVRRQHTCQQPIQIKFRLHCIDPPINCYIHELPRPSATASPFRNRASRCGHRSVCKPARRRCRCLGG